MTSTRHNGRSPMSIVSFFNCKCSDQAESGMRFLNLFLTLADPSAANNSCHIRLYCSFIPGNQVLLRGKNAGPLWGCPGLGQSCATELQRCKAGGAATEQLASPRLLSRPFGPK